MANVAVPLARSASRPNSPRDYIRANIQDVHELSELNRAQHEAEAERQRIEEEQALLMEMGLIDKNGNETPKSLRSRCNSPNKINLRSRSSSPSAILHVEKITEDSADFVNADDGMRKPVAHNSRLRSVSRSQPLSNDGSPKNSKIPKRQNSVSPARSAAKSVNRAVANGLNKNQRFMSNSTSSIHDNVKFGRAVSGPRTSLSKSSQNLSISPSILKSKPPISPGKAGPPPTNRALNSKRLSPIVGTPNKSPTGELLSKRSSAQAISRLSSVNKVTNKTTKTARNTPVTSRFASKNTSRVTSRDTSPDNKPKQNHKATANSIKSTDSDAKIAGTIKGSASKYNVSKQNLSDKTDAKKAVSRVSSIRNLSRSNSTKTLTDTHESTDGNMTKKDKDEKLGQESILTFSNKNNKLDEITKESTDVLSTKIKSNEVQMNSDIIMAEKGDAVGKQDSETQYDKVSHENDKQLIPMTKMNVVSMTTAAITAQPLDVVTKVTNQLPSALEKAREKGVFERLSSNDSILGKNNHDSKDGTLEKKSSKSSLLSVKDGDNVKLKPLQPPFNNPLVEKAKQKIDDILKGPEVSTENILKHVQKEIKTAKDSTKVIASTSQNIVSEAEKKDSSKANDAPDIKGHILKTTHKTTDDIRTEATKIVDSILTPIEEPIREKVKEVKKTIEPVVRIVNEKPKPQVNTELLEKMTESVIKGDAEVEVQSSNISLPHVQKMEAQRKATDGAESDQSSRSNGGLPRSTSTTPRPVPPARAHRPAASKALASDEPEEEPKKNICQRLMGKCASRCSCCGKNKAEDVKSEMMEVRKEAEKLAAEAEKKKSGRYLRQLNCWSKSSQDEEAKAEAGAGKVETPGRWRRLACCRARRVGDSSSDMRAPEIPGGPGCCARLVCCGRNDREDVDLRRDSILSDRSPRSCCGGLCARMCGPCGRRAPPPSRRPSMFSKNKSLSPTLPTEDTRRKLDTSLVEHTSSMRGAIPVLPIVLAYFCLACNVFVPGLGTVFSGILCLCFGIPRFGIYDGAKPRIGSLVINTLVGAAQLFTVLFCLVGWGWSIWWGTIMLKVARKYRKLRESAASDAEAAAGAPPPVTSTNHTAAAT